MKRRVVKSTMRTFEVLELFADERRPLRLQEVYAALEYPQSSTTNLLKSMVLMGYLNYHRKSRTYFPTPLVAKLGNWISGYIHSSGAYRRLAEELQARTDETVAVAAQNDLFVQYNVLLTPNHEFKLAPPVGTMRTMVNSSSGLAMMSKMKNRDIDKLCRYTNYYELNKSEHVSVEEVMRRVDWVRHVGYSFVPNSPSPEVSSISMPLDTDPHGVPQAIGVGGLSDRIGKNSQRIVSIMSEVISKFSQETITETPYA
ncbi:MAG: helix-turn-helix domain-containing protein [Henriciella sp.]|nr:helix-turn-helix domain-containing protein [Henriciella sp.]